MVNYKALADSIVKFDELLAGSPKDRHITVVDKDTVFDNAGLAIERNKVISLLKRNLITSNGYMNIPMLLLFCQTFAFKYSNVHSMTNQSSFNLIYGDLNIKVTT